MDSNASRPIETAADSNRHGSWSGAALLIGLMLAGTALAAWQGKFIPVRVPDTPLYTDFPFHSLHQALSNNRTPVYPLFVKTAGALAPNLMWVPWAHWLCCLGAVAVFYLGLVRFSVAPQAAAVVAAALLTSNLVVHSVPRVIADCLAGTWAIAAVGLLIARLGGRTGVGWLLALGVATALAWLTRPAYLFLVFLVPVLGGLLAPARKGHSYLRVAGAEAARLSLLGGLPVLGYCVLRWCVVGSFGIVACGGFNFAGLSGQFLEERDVDRLPAAVQPVARTALELRSQLPATDLVMQDADPRNYTRIESNYDVTIWKVFVPAAERHHGDDYRAINRELRRLSSAIVRIHPESYALWIAKALRQGVFKIVGDFVVNPFGLGLTLLALALTLAIVVPAIGRRCDAPAEGMLHRRVIPLLFVVTVGYAGASLGLVILVAPPIGRFTDAMGVFVPALMAAIVLQQAGRLGAQLRERRAAGRG